MGLRGMKVNEQKPHYASDRHFLPRWPSDLCPDPKGCDTWSTSSEPWEPWEPWRVFLSKLGALGF